ncbi:MAG: cytochrome c3 family protein [Dehalococcoidia bacterium]
MAVKITVPVVGLLLVIGVIVVGVGVLKSWWSLPPGQVQVKATQPIDFPHDVHVQNAQIDCQFCHRTVTETEAASLPAVQQCYFCHQVVATESPEVAKIITAFENDQPINWVRVHRLPDHVQFVHDIHVRFFSGINNVAPSQSCSICHGDVGSMGIAQQVRNLKMRDCVDCHRGGYLQYVNEESNLAIRQAMSSLDRAQDQVRKARDKLGLARLEGDPQKLVAQEENFEAAGENLDAAQDQLEEAGLRRAPPTDCAACHY